MTPGARVAAAIEVLDAIEDGLAAEQALTRWARGSRFAGSKDRAAVRDHVFDVLRNHRAAAHFGGGSTGRARMIGHLSRTEDDLDALFDGNGHAPAPISEAEAPVATPPTDKGVLWNLPDWLLAEFEASLGDRAAATAATLQSRGPVTLRINAARTTRAKAQALLAEEGIDTTPNSLSETALTVVSNPRRVRLSAAYTDGVVELQDAASQAVVDLLPTASRVLDYCAGGGGKSLALAARPDTEVLAHDSDPNRMSDLPARAARAGAQVHVLAAESLEAAAPFELILCDAPCSGSGAWRRSAEGKWRLTAEILQELADIQDQILHRAAALLAHGGTLAYATCSVLRIENEDRVEAFLTAHPGWSCTLQRRFDVTPEGDGFFTAHLTRD